MFWNFKVDILDLFSAHLVYCTEKWDGSFYFIIRAD